jgi:hypothetical protein
MSLETEERWRNAVNAAELLAHITTARILLFLEMENSSIWLKRTDKLISRVVVKLLKIPSVSPKLKNFLSALDN